MKIKLSLLACGAFWFACKTSSNNKDSDVQSIPVPRSTSMASFTETMRGHLTTNAQFLGKMGDLESQSTLNTYNQAYDDRANSAGDADKTYFTLTINVDTSGLGPNSEGAGEIAPFGKDVYREDAGFLETTLLNGKKERLPVIEGRFNLLIGDESEFRLRKFRYNMKMRASNGDFIYFYGFKNVRQDKEFASPLEIWRDTSTLYVTMFRGDDVSLDQFDRDSLPASFKLIGKGRMHIEPADLARQLTTMRGGEPGKGLLNGLGALSGFGGYFVDRILKTYVDHDLASIDRLKLNRPITKNGNPLAPTWYPIHTADGLDLALLRYDGSNGQGLPILSVAGLGVNNLIFTHNTTDTNYVQYMVNKGFDVWLLEARFNTDHKAYIKLGKDNGDDTFNDYQAAINKILDITKKPKLNIFAHCYGAHTVLESIINGLRESTVDGRKVQTVQTINSLMLSQASFYADVLPAKKMQIETLGNFIEHFPDVRVHFLTTTPEEDDYPQAASVAFDAAVLAYNKTALGFDYFSRENIREYGQLTAASKRANDRIRFIYGELHELKNLSPAMKKDTGLPMVYGPAGVGHLAHIQKMVDKGTLVDHYGTSYTAPDASLKVYMQKFKMPIGILHGRQNKTWLLSGSEKSIQMLDREHPGVEHKLYVVDNHGHLDTIYGTDAGTTSFPMINDFFSRHNN